ncbi:MAG: hypothetical protein AAB870_05375 [Patescibacteria group bacterium]
MHIRHRRGSYYLRVILCAVMFVSAFFPVIDVDAVDQIKTVELYVGDTPTAVSSQVNHAFSIYIGDNISGVTTPVKSALFTITGVYTSTGSPTLQAQLNSTGATSKTFILPNVGSTPTPFEILYSDPTNSINPATAGSYSHTLNLIPTNMTAYGLGAHLTLTYRYKPPSCGYPPFGDVVSTVFDTTASSDGPAYNSMSWKGTLPANTKVKFQIATSASSSGPFNFVGGATCTSTDYYESSGQDIPVEISCDPTFHNNQRYFKYKIRLCSANDCTSSGADTPQVDDVNISWSP